MREVIRKRLIEEIEASGLSLVEIAKKIGIKHTNISQYRTKNKLPSLEHFAKLCAVIGADANYILGITNQ